MEIVLSFSVICGDQKATKGRNTRCSFSRYHPSKQVCPLYTLHMGGMLEGFGRILMPQHDSARFNRREKVESLRLLMSTLGVRICRIEMRFNFYFHFPCYGAV